MAGNQNEGGDRLLSTRNYAQALHYGYTAGRRNAREKIIREWVKERSVFLWKYKDRIIAATSAWNNSRYLLIRDAGFRNLKPVMLRLNYVLLRFGLGQLNLVDAKSRSKFRKQYIFTSSTDPPEARPWPGQLFFAMPNEETRLASYPPTIQERLNVWATSLDFSIHPDWENDIPWKRAALPLTIPASDLPSTTSAMD
jgi:hypothetical protein